MISLKQIKYALAVQKHLHFRKAAEECAVSQSAMSTALAEMERQLGFAVFERNNKKVFVTPIGEQALQKARAIQVEVNDLLRLVETQKSELSYPMSVGIIPTICPYLLPAVLPGLRDNYPDFNMRVIEDQSQQLVEKVRAGLIDTAIVALPYDVEGLLTFEFWQEDFFWVTHSSELPANTREIASNDIDQSRLILLQDGHCLKDHVLQACNMNSDQAHNLSATSLTTVSQLVSGKMGTTLIPQMALPGLVNNNRELAAVHLSEPGPHRRIAFIVRPNYTGVKNIEALITLFKLSLTKLY